MTIIALEIPARQQCHSQAMTIIAPEIPARQQCHSQAMEPASFYGRNRVLWAAALFGSVLFVNTFLLEQYLYVNTDFRAKAPPHNTTTHNFSAVKNDALSDKTILREEGEIATTSQPKKDAVNDPLEEFRLCSATPDSQYYCSGSEYNKFAAKLQELVLNETAKRERKAPSFWGKRSTPVPVANSTILFLGNSHTRQLYLSLVCQYQDKILEFNRKNETVADVMNVRLENNVNLVAVTNHYLVYSKNWRRMLEQETGLDLSIDVDAVVLGRINDLSNTRGTNFEKWIEEISANRTDISMQSQPPPGIKEVAKEYSGPIVLTSMFAKYAEPIFVAQVEEAKVINAKETIKLNRSSTSVASSRLSPSSRRIHIVNARKFVRALGECATDSGNKVGVCNQMENWDVGSSRSPADMHRCVGSKGGHPGLIAWEVIEALYLVMA